MIEFCHVSRSYGRKVAVADLDLVVPSGELFAFLGPNGAGKTTSIKVLVGLLRPSSGRVRVCGFDVESETRQANSVVGYIPDEPYLYDKLTGREFLQFIAGMYGLPTHVADERIAREIARFELADFVDDLCESYSHGMKQRVALAAALLHDPDVLVLDEPTVGLDPRTVRMMKDLLRERAAMGTTVFMSTHSLSVAEEIADRVGIVDRGRLRCVGTIDELRRRSRSLGKMSLEQLFLEITASPDEAAAAAPVSASPDEDAA
ncbi:MAG: ABC transporter ATP-binding protein [Planctomycetia bacterium]|nr:ABC transporter ATP-binding protein [Planctomycetia bacterium]